MLFSRFFFLSFDGRSKDEEKKTHRQVQANSVIFHRLCRRPRTFFPGICVCIPKHKKHDIKLINFPDIPMFECAGKIDLREIKNFRRTNGN
jgi:hypothetical protein